MGNHQTVDIFRFDQERQLTERIRKMLFADLLAPILEKCKYAEEKDYWRSIYEGRGLRLTSQLAPKLHQMCNEVKETLDFKEPVEFFVTNDPSVNAVSILRKNDQNSHLIVFNSGLIEKFFDNELRFVIGHELAHVIYRTADLRRLIFNLYPDFNLMPLPIINLIRLWDKFAEISADRLGFIAAPDLENCVSNFFKLSSGLNLDRVNFNLEEYLKEVDNILEKYTEADALFHESHPTNPIRVKAIQYFSESELYRAYRDGTKEVKEDLSLNEKMDKLVKLLELHPDNEQDHHRLLLIATGGFLLAGIDEEITPDEEEKILTYLSNYTIYPRFYLKSLLQKVKAHDDIIALFMGSIKKLMEIDPSEKELIFNYLCEVALADRQLTQTEIDFIMNIAINLLGFHEIETSRRFLDHLKVRQFRPRF